MTIAKKDNPKLWEKVKEEGIEKFGGWSARVAQWSVREYKKRGGEYIGKKDTKSNSLRKWTDEDWGTKSGQRSRDTGERYLPRKIREELSDEEYRSTSRKKRADTKKGRQWSPQPKKIKEKVSEARRRYFDD